MDRPVKRRFEILIGRYTANPMMRGLFKLGITPPGMALVETIGGARARFGTARRLHARRPGHALADRPARRARRLGAQLPGQPPGSGTPRPALAHGTAELLPDDDVKARIRTFSDSAVGRAVTAATFRALESQPVTVRIALEASTPPFALRATPRRNARRQKRPAERFPFCGKACSYSPPSRRPRRCITIIEPPAAATGSPPPTVQVRLKPVNGRVLAFAGSVVVVGVVLVVAGSTVLAGVVVVGVFVDFDGEVPLFGVVGALRPGYSPLWRFCRQSRRRGRNCQRQDDRQDHEPAPRARGSTPRRCSSAVSGLLEAMTLVRVMPTSRSWSCELRPEWASSVICPPILLAKRLPC